MERKKAADILFSNGTRIRGFYAIAAARVHVVPCATHVYRVLSIAVKAGGGDLSQTSDGNHYWRQWLSLQATTGTQGM